MRRRTIARGATRKPSIALLFALTVGLAAEATGVASAAPGDAPIDATFAGRSEDDRAVRLHVIVEPDGARATLRLRPDEPAGSYSGSPMPSSERATGEMTRELDLSDEGGRARLRGTLDLRKGVFEGEWSAGRRREPLHLALVAETSVCSRSRGPRLATELRAPSFLAPAAAAPALDALVAERLGASQQSFFSEGVTALADRKATPAAWHQSVVCSLTHWSEDLVSLLVHDWHYTGGAHGNSEWFGITVRITPDGDTREIELPELFRDGEGWEKWLAETAWKDLRKQGASSIVDGTKRILEPEDFGAWALSVDGLTLVFPPYAVGSWAEGAYRVTIPLERLEKRAAPRGPLESLRRE